MCSTAVELSSAPFPCSQPNLWKAFPCAWSLPASYWKVVLPLSSLATEKVVEVIVSLKPLAPTALNWNDAISYSNSYTNLDTGTGVYSNWYLPSKDELQLMYANLQRFGCGTITPATTDPSICKIGKANFAGYYWSSTEYDINNAWLQFFAYGNPYSYDKDITYYVRAVRVF